MGQAVCHSGTVLSIKHNKRKSLKFFFLVFFCFFFGKYLKLLNPSAYVMFSVSHFRLFRKPTVNLVFPAADVQYLSFQSSTAVALQSI